MTAGADGGLRQVRPAPSSGHCWSEIGTIVPACYLLGCGTAHLILGFTPK
jgi:hypothetical protein